MEELKFIEINHLPIRILSFQQLKMSKIDFFLVDPPNSKQTIKQTNYLNKIPIFEKKSIY